MSDPHGPSLTEVVSRVVEDAKEVARAELALVKAQAMTRVGGYRAAVILFATAGLIGLLAAIGLVVGVILTLATLIGPGWATLAVVGTLLLIAGILAMMGARRWGAK